jgi:hypothetical protein
MTVAKTLIVTVVAAAALGCGSENKSEFSMRYLGAVQLPPGRLDVTITDPAVQRSRQGLPLNTPTVTLYDSQQTEAQGQLSISYVMKDGATQLSTGAISLDIRGDWIWDITLSVDTLNPARLCFGCSGSKSFPLSTPYQRNARDSVWLTWGGNSIAHPVIY